MESKKAVRQFISNIVSKDYSQANSSLQKMIEIKLKEQIKTSLTPKK